MFKNKSSLVSLICIFAITIGFIGIYAGHLESGRTLVATVITGFFGYASQDDDFFAEIIFLASVITAAFVIYMIGSGDSFNESLALVISAIGGYLGYLQQETNRKV